MSFYDIFVKRDIFLLTANSNTDLARTEGFLFFCLQGRDTSRGHVVSGFSVGHDPGCIIAVVVPPGLGPCVFKE